MKQKPMRSKNKLRNKKGAILLTIYTIIMSYALINLFFNHDSFGLYMGLFFLFINILFSFGFYFEIRKVKKFFKYANDFEDNDSWLPHHYKFGQPRVLKRLDDAGGFENLMSKMGHGDFVKGMELDLELVHDYKKRTELKLKEWDTISIPSDDDFYSNKKRMRLSGREAIYSKGERSKIKQDFMRQITFYDNVIAKINKLLNKALERGSDVKKDITNNTIEGLNMSDE